MGVLVIIIHVIVCLALIMIVLLQTGKGADMGAAFGGGSSQTLFGSSGGMTFLNKATTAVAVIFMVTSFILAYMSANRQPASIMTKAAVEEKAPAGDTATEPPAATPNTATGDQSAAPATSDAPAAPATTE